MAKLCVTMGLAAVLALSACATTQRPVLYPNAHLKNTGDASARRDVDQCMQLASDSGVEKSSNQVVRRGTEGAAVGAAAAGVGTLIRGGSVGAGAAAGAAVGAAAGAVHGAFRNDASPTYRNFVQRCLHERGYDVIGWQ
jgi:outer membrane lipoprotein SlyB